jgi:hypothetical protein
MHLAGRGSAFEGALSISSGRVFWYLRGSERNIRHAIRHLQPWRTVMSEEQQVRLNVHTEKMGTSYANAFQVRYSQDDVLVSFGVSLTDLSAEPGVKGVVTADMLERIAMTPRTAKRLTLTLIQSLREYEARFGEIAVEEKAPEEE